MLLGLMALPLLGQVRQPKHPGLKDYRWQNRLLLVFTPSGEDASLAEQLRLFEKEQPAFAERDLLLLQVEGEQPVEVKGRQPLSAASLRQAYKVKEEAFTLVLVGKDGGEKYRSTGPTAAQAIYRIIDAMPMRQAEMRRKD